MKEYIVIIESVWDGEVDLRATRVFADTIPDATIEVIPRIWHAVGCPTGEFVEHDIRSHLRRVQVFQRDVVADVFVEPQLFAFVKKREQERNKEERLKNLKNKKVKEAAELAQYKRLHKKYKGKTQ